MFSSILSALLYPFHKAALLSRDPRMAGAFLLLAAIMGPLAASSSLKPLYHAFLEARIFSLSIPLHTLVSEGLMTVFFLSLALEIRHALVDGPLNHWRKAALPLFAAIGGMAVPAAIAAACGLLLPVAISATGEPAYYSLAGWAIPTATDAAFTVSIMAVLPLLPANLRIFLMALAIFDDLGAIIILALFYGHNPNLLPLGLALLPLGAMIFCAVCRIKSLWAYLPFATGLWFCLFYAGIEPTLAGVALGFCLPVHKGETLGQKLVPPLNLFILPLFAFSSTDIDLRTFQPAFVATSPFLGTALGLFIGKPIGISGSVWLATKTRLLPAMAYIQGQALVGVSMLCGIGFTISLLITQLAYSGQPWEGLGLMEGRCGVLAGSALSAFFGWILLRFQQSGWQASQKKDGLEGKARS